MDEKTIALAGAVTAATVLGRGVRPAAKTLMKGYLVVADATAGARRSVSDLYAEASAEHRVEAHGAGRPTAAAPAASEVTEPSAPTEGSRVPKDADA
ncbi:MAG: hypothetical protein M3502_01960 [Actinomycetota bacterium]|jgi:hypothetical protein|nr:hypothetical protein [Actinomycetota bacterium]